MRSHCWVEVDILGRMLRIFKSRATKEFHKALMEDRVVQVARSVAISGVRTEVFRLADGKCKYCGGVATDMHEEGKIRSLGGEISIWNSVASCRRDHQKQHGDRKLHWGGSNV